MATATVEKLKPYPYAKSQVIENQALMMVKMVAPQCPCESDADAETIDAHFAARNRERRTRPAKEYRGQENCQSGRTGRGWWIECEEKGHNPYYLKLVTTREETVVDDEGIITGKRQREIVRERLNVVAVPHSLRHDSGRAIDDAVANKGYKRMRDLGFQEVCMMRGCELPATLVYPGFGEFCNDRHARLAKADQEEVFLIVHGTERTKWQKRRQDQLDELNMGEFYRIDPATRKAVK